LAETLQPVRGTRDLIGEEQRRHAHVVDTARRVAALYGHEEWQTPIFEETRVFARTLGDTSDVVTKEMYSFADRGGDSITLRPEGTAGVCRAIISNGLTQTLPQKVFYAGPMFRYERPQKGRYRQFHQIGAELIGAPEPLADAEVIALGWNVLRKLGVAKDVTLELNTLGDRESRAAWREELVAYFSRVRTQLSFESRQRLEKNPLRILDSKDPQDRRLLANAPTIQFHLGAEARQHWATVLHRLKALDVPYVYNPWIVRGLDYYNHTAFEFITSALGAQGTVMAGGRYDGLVKQLGGPDLPGVGWAAGIERLAMLIGPLMSEARLVAVIPIGGEVEELLAFQVVQSIREAGVRAEMSYRGTLKRRMERADKLGATTAVIIGPEERVQHRAKIKDLQSGQEITVPLAELPDRLR
jgi:histidyl-tRNA synthetase